MALINRNNIAVVVEFPFDKILMRFSSSLIGEGQGGILDKDSSRLLKAPWCRKASILPRDIPKENPKY